VLQGTPRYNTSDPRIQDTIWLARENVDRPAPHWVTLQFVDGLDKPGHDQNSVGTYHLSPVQKLRLDSTHLVR